MIISFTNANPSTSSRPTGAAFLLSAIIFLFIPVSIIVLGYYSTQPTGTLISPLPQTRVSESPSPTETPTPVSQNQPIIASDQEVNAASSSGTQNSNSQDSAATIPAGATETEVQNPKITPNTQILLIPKAGDSTIYYVKSKDNGKFTIGTDNPSSEDRLIDYQMVNP